MLVAPPVDHFNGLQQLRRMLPNDRFAFAD